MYNEELKNRFIKMRNDDVILAPRYFERLFAKTEMFEELLQKDCSCWTKVNIMDFYKYLSTPSLETLIDNNNKLSQYCQFCLQESLVPDHQNHYLEMTTDNIVSCISKTAISKKVITRERLLISLNSIQNVVDKFIALACFEGFKGGCYKEIWQLHTSDIDTENNTVTLCTGRTINISQELIDLAFESASIYKYYTISSSGKSKIRSLYGDADLIVKVSGNAADDENQAGKRIRARIIKNIRNIGLDESLGGNALYISGMIEMINRLARENNMTAKDVLYNKELLAMIEQQYCSIKQTRLRFLKKYEEFLV